MKKKYPKTESSYLHFLPRIYRETPDKDLPPFFDSYLKIFERIWGEVKDDRLFDYVFSIPLNKRKHIKDGEISEELNKRFKNAGHDLSRNARIETLVSKKKWRLHDHDHTYLICREEDKFDVSLSGRKGIEELLDVIADFFHPRFSFLFSKIETEFIPDLDNRDLQTLNKYFTPNKFFDDWLEDFLFWFAGAMSLTLRKQWSVHKKRQVIAEIIPLYRMRGTKIGLEKYLSIYIGEKISITESIKPMYLGDNTFVEGAFTLEGSPYFFDVHVTLKRMPVAELRMTIKSLIEIIETEKPAHTNYKLHIDMPTIDLENHSRLGEDTILGK
ncbi:phage tail protein [Candidatus Uabimicrobium sp. HlEnr_7]|uniref:phage tail protein n=1 Tax=Candidatus Uabimicrobium helgolandensis TaxID=3095367 RepID=UPI00355623BD